jgi:hypothetical protein
MLTILVNLMVMMNLMKGEKVRIMLSLYGLEQFGYWFSSGKDYTYKSFAWQSFGFFQQAQAYTCAYCNAVIRDERDWG